MLYLAEPAVRSTVRRWRRNGLDLADDVGPGRLLTREIPGPQHSSSAATPDPGGHISHVCAGEIQFVSITLPARRPGAEDRTGFPRRHQAFPTRTDASVRLLGTDVTRQLLRRKPPDCADYAPNPVLYAAASYSTAARMVMSSRASAGPFSSLSYRQLPVLSASAALYLRATALGAGNRGCRRVPKEGTSLRRRSRPLLVGSCQIAVLTAARRKYRGFHASHLPNTRCSRGFESAPPPARGPTPVPEHARSHTCP